MKTKTFIFITVVIASGIILSGCADNEFTGKCLTGYTYGFFSGFWHGLTAIFSLVGMLFSDEIAVYAPNNNGFWYALGFIMGSGGSGMLGTRMFR